MAILGARSLISTLFICSYGRTNSESLSLWMHKISPLLTLGLTYYPLAWVQTQLYMNYGYLPAILAALALISGVCIVFPR